MKIHDEVELALSRVFQRLPLWENSANLWAWWLCRRLLVYGSCIYVTETLLGYRRRPLGSSPMRLFDLNSWFPKSLDKNMDEESRAFLEAAGYPVLKPNKRDTCTAEPITFYSDAKHSVALHPLPDDEPQPSIEGQVTPPGFFVFMQTLRVFGHFEIDEGVKIWKSSEVKTLQPNELLFDFGELDEYIHVVMDGSISICIDDDSFGVTRIKSVKANEHILSLVAVLDFVTKTSSYPKPVRAYADEVSIVLQVPMQALLDHYNRRPQTLNCLVRQLMTKVRQLYFEGLHEVAALNKHILKPHMMQSKYIDFEDNMEDVNGNRKEILAGIRKYLPLEDKDFAECWQGTIEEGTIVSRVGRPVKNLVYVHRGELVVVIQANCEKLDKEYKGNVKYAKYSHEDTPVYYLGPGSVVGSWGLLSTYTSFYTVKVPKNQKAVIVEIPGHIVKRIWDQKPEFLFPFVKKLLGRLSESSRQMDYCMEWKILAPGRIVYRRGDPRIATFLVLSGRLRYRVYGSHVRAKRLEMDAKCKYGSYETGDWFGFVECVVASDSMQKTVVADRYAEIVTLPAELITLLYQKYPHITTAMATYLALRIHKDYNYEEITPRNDQQDASDILGHPQYALSKTPPSSILAVFPLTKEIPGELYCIEVCRHYPKKAKFLSFDHFQEYVNHDQSRINLTELIHWLSNYQNDYEPPFIVLLGIVDNEIGLWNTIIARQADFIQVLATLHCPLDIIKIEEMIQIEGWKAVKDFTFLHPAGLLPEDNDRAWRPILAAPMPRGSAKWLIKRPWLDTHHHARFPNCAFQFMKTLEVKYLKEFEDYKKLPIDKHSDISRLCRWFSNTMVGLVLGGGGAKGAAQLGFFEYIKELDIPIDYVCGVSIGSFVGALYSVHQSYPDIEKRVRHLFKELEKPSKYASDITIPYSSIFRGRSFDEFVQHSFNDVRIEDVWVPYFCVTTDITGCHSRVHRHGVMWFYVRASMTLTMVFPPLVNHRDQHLLMDGGYSEILPGNHLRAAGVRYVLAVDIGDQNGIPLFNIGYECSGIKCILQYLMPVNSWPTVPTRFAFWEQLNYIAARKYVNLLKKIDRRVIYVRPAVEFYSGKDFSKVDEISMMGFYTTRRRFTRVRKGLSVSMMWKILQMYDPEFPVIIDKPRQMEMDEISKMTKTVRRSNDLEPD